MQRKYRGENGIIQESGTPFWNQFFVAALRDAENNVVNFVGVQCEVSKAVVEKHISEGKTAATLPRQIP